METNKDLIRDSWLLLGILSDVILLLGILLDYGYLSAHVVHVTSFLLISLVNKIFRHMIYYLKNQTLVCWFVIVLEIFISGFIESGCGFASALRPES